MFLSFCVLMIFSVFQKNWVLGYSWSTLLWHRCYYPHRSRDALSPLCGIFSSYFVSILWDFIGLLMSQKNLLFVTYLFSKNHKILHAIFTLDQFLIITLWAFRSCLLRAEPIMIAFMQCWQPFRFSPGELSGAAEAQQCSQLKGFSPEDSRHWQLVSLHLGPAAQGRERHFAPLVLFYDQTQIPYLLVLCTTLWSLSNMHRLLLSWYHAPNSALSRMH